MKKNIDWYLKFESCVQLHHDAMLTQKKNKHTTKFYVVDYQIDPFAERIQVQSFSRKKGWAGALGRPVYVSSMF